MYRTDFWTLWEKARVGCFKRTASKHVYYLWWNWSPAQVGCMRQVLGPGALGRPRGIGSRGRWEGGSGWGTHVDPRLIHVSVWQKPLQYCKVISLQLIKINLKKENHLENLGKLKTAVPPLRGSQRLCFSGLERSQRICISYKLPGDAVYWVLLLLLICSVVSDSLRSHGL